MLLLGVRVLGETEDAGRGQRTDDEVDDAAHLGARGVTRDREDDEDEEDEDVIIIYDMDAASSSLGLDDDDDDDEDERLLPVVRGGVRQTPMQFDVEDYDDDGDDDDDEAGGGDSSAAESSPIPSLNLPRETSKFSYF